MKVKKLLTVLALTTMLTACSINGGGDQPQPQPQPGPVEEVKYTVSFAAGEGGSGSMAAVADVKGEYELPACTFTAPQGYEFAGWKVNGQGETLAAGAKIQVTADTQLVAQWGLIRALASISVEGPTKTTYAAGEELSLEGLVVTAHYNDNTTEVVTNYTTNAADVDMKASGTKPITVTYNGLTANFSVTVAAPTDWSDEVKALFTANVYGASIPFFYSYDLGLGDLEWSAANGKIVATGGAVTCDDQGTSSTSDDVLVEPTAVFALFEDAGWNIVSDGSRYWYFEALLPVTVGENQRFVDAKFGAYGSDWAGAGNFRLEIQDPYFYTWESTGWEALMQSVFGTELDIPNLPNGLYSKSQADLFALYYQYYRYIPVQVAGATQADLQAVLAAVQADEHWDVGAASVSSDYDYIAVSDDGKLFVGIALGAQATTFTFKAQDEVAPEVTAVAAQFGLKDFTFEKDDDVTGQFDYIAEVELGEGQTLKQLREQYGEFLAGESAAPLKFTQVGSEKTGETYNGARYVYESEQLNVDVMLYAFTQGEKYYIELDVSALTPVPQGIKDICQVLGINQYDLVIDEDSGDFFIDIYDVDQELTYTQLVGVYTALLDADHALGDDAVANMEPLGAITETENYSMIQYVNDTLLIYVYAATSSSKNSKFVEIAFQDYNPAPESAWVANIADKTNREFKWDNSSKLFYNQGSVTLGDEETYAQRVAAIASELMDADENLDLLSSRSGSTYAEMKLYCADGYITIQVWNDGDYDDEDNWVPGPDKYVIMINLFAHPENPAMLNGLIAAMGLDVAPVYDDEDNLLYYYALSDTYAVNAGISLEQWGSTLANGYSEAALIRAATGLGFTVDAEHSGWDAEHHMYVVTLTNAKGWTVEVLIRGNASDLYTGYNQIYIYAPAA